MSNITLNKHKKAFDISKYWIDKIGLDLSELNVLTEVGSNSYTYLPLIASISGANVTAWCNDSKFGVADEIILEAKNAIKIWDCKGPIIFRSNDRNFDDIQKADIITNSGMLRPLDSQFLSFVKTNSVISLMFESWELRSTDIDLNFCKEKGIKVSGVSENNAIMNIFEYAGILACKLILNSGIEIFQSKILIWSSDEFGEVAKKWISKLLPKNIIICNETEKFYHYLEDIDLVYFCDYLDDRPYFGPTGFLDLEIISRINSTVTFCHLYGNISKSECNKYGINLFPNKDGYNKVMSETLSFVGPEPVIQLLVAGLKAAQETIEGGSFVCAQRII
jgi:hypothetical protein